MKKARGGMSGRTLEKSMSKVYLAGVRPVYAIYGIGHPLRFDSTVLNRRSGACFNLKRNAAVPFLVE